MGLLSCTIGGNAVTLKNQSFSVAGAIETRSTMTITVEDAAGTLSFQPRQPVVLSDSVTGVLFAGYVSTSKPKRIAPSTAGASVTIEHVVSVIDLHYKADKQANQQNYVKAYAGDIALDFWRRALQAEGVVANAAIIKDTTVADFTRGILSGTVATQDVGDGVLTLVAAGLPVTITESTTTIFGAGALTNVVAVNNTLSPTTQSAIKLVTSLSAQQIGAQFSLKFWGGSQVVGPSDTFNYDIFIADTCPQELVTVDLIFSDNTTLSGTTLFDQNQLLLTPATDLSKYAKDTWYTRTIALTGLTGKTVSSVVISLGGTNIGTYTLYVKNCYLGSQSGNKFLAPNASAPQTNPPQVVSNSGYLTSSSQLVSVFIPGTSTRVSPAYSIDAVKLLRSSLLTWSGITPTGTTISLLVSYDSGTSWIPATNNAPLPALPSGSNVSGMTVNFQEVFGLSGPDPTLIPALTQVTLTLLSAANATKSDVAANYAGSTAWNTGTFTNTSVNSLGNLAVNQILRNWNDSTISNQTSFFPSGVTQSASGAKYTINNSGATVGSGRSRLDFAGSVTNFTLDIDLTLPADTTFPFISYRTTAWSSNNFSSAYQLFLGAGAGNINLARGTNTTGGGSSTTIATAATSWSALSAHHVTLIVTGTRHQMFLDSSTTAAIDVTDSTYQSAGNIGLCIELTGGSTTGATIWDNLVMGTTTGVWLSPSVSISSLGTCGLSDISWYDIPAPPNTILPSLIEVTTDGGATFQPCTNNGLIPNLSPGTSVVGKSLQVRATLAASGQASIGAIVWRLLGAYPGASGTRTTLPMGMDSMTRANVVSGWGTATDSQTYTQVGTGTTALTSNEALITNTTGDVHMLYGSRTWTDMDGTCRFSLSVNTISAGIELRYTDLNNFYRFQASTTTLTLIKRIVGTSYTLATASMALPTGVFYRMRFRVVGNYPTTASGKVWVDGTLEPTTWNITFTE